MKFYKDDRLIEYKFIIDNKYPFFVNIKVIKIA